MTDAEAIYRFRVTVLEHAAATGNVTATCTMFRVSRKSFYKWRDRAERYGLEALMPKARRAPQMPNATPTHIVARLLTLAVNDPTVGTPTKQQSAMFITKVVGQFQRRGIGVRAVVTDNGPEWIAHGFRARLAELEIDHHRIPPRSPSHNAVVERFHGIALEECGRPAFHRRRFTTIRQLQAEADAWLTTYNNHRRNHGAYLTGRTPAQMLDTRHPDQAA